MEAIKVEEYEEMDLNSTTYSEFAADLPGNKEVFSSSFMSTRNDQAMNSVKEEPDSDTTPMQHSQISRVSSFFDEIGGFPNDEDLGLSSSDSSWVREFGEGEHPENTFMSREEHPPPVLKNTSQTVGSNKKGTNCMGIKRKICDSFSEVEEEKENRTGVKERKEDAPVSSFSLKSIQIPKKLPSNKQPKSTEKTSKQNPKRRNIILKEKQVKLSFSCNICSQSFSRKKRLNAHTKTHKTGCSSDPCVLCGKTFRLMSESKRHKYTHMNWDELQKTRVFHAKCYFCNDQRIFLIYGHYERHLNIHTEEKPYKCRTWSKRFAQKGNLKQHEVVHSKEKRFKCNKCGQRFTRSDSLKAHDLVHMDKSTRAKTERSWKNECEFCKKKFRTPTDLNRHTPTHTGEKKFTCSHCHQTFTRNSSKTRHEKSQH